VFESSKKKEVGVSDLTLISKISNEAINDNLKKRFENAEIYVCSHPRTIQHKGDCWSDKERLTCWQTYIGHVLVSVNPFRDCESMGARRVTDRDEYGLTGYSGNIYRHSTFELSGEE
jgi:hypothetical protein